MLELLAILAWPVVALCALGVFAWLVHARVTRFEDYEARHADLRAKYEAHGLERDKRVSSLAERVGQLEMAQGVKRGR